jgi:hypothetical protein
LQSETNVIAKRFEQIYDEMKATQGEHIIHFDAQSAIASSKESLRSTEDVLYAEETT